MSDVKGDLSGISQPGGSNAKVAARVAQLALTDFAYQACPVTFWDPFGEMGHPVRATISDMGPLLLGRMLNLNDTQAGVLNLVFKIADDNGLLLLDLKDLRAMLQYVGDNADDFTTEYGNVSAASIGAIQRGLLALESQGGEKIFGEPMLDIADLIQTDANRARHGQHPVRRQADAVAQAVCHPAAVAAVGAVREPARSGRPGQAQAGVLFRRGPPAVQRRAASPGGQNRAGGAAHPLQGRGRLLRHPEPGGRARQGTVANSATVSSTPCAPSARAIRKPSRPLPKPCATIPTLDEETVITELGVGEALVSFLDEKGRPGMVERAFILPPQGQIGPITPQQRQTIIASSLVAGHYEKEVDRESAYELLKGRAAQTAATEQAAAAQVDSSKAETARPAAACLAPADCWAPSSAAASGTRSVKVRSKPWPKAPHAPSARK